jgi:hypothetical protein
MKFIFTFFYIFFFYNLAAQNVNVAWAKSIGGQGDDFCNSVTTDAYGNVYATGFFTYTVDFDPGPEVFDLISTGISNNIYVTKLNQAGNLIWAKEISGGTCFANSINLDTSGNIYITGSFGSTVDFDPGLAVYNLTTFGGYDVFVCKLDSSGNFIWAKSFDNGNTGYNNGWSLAIDSNGNIYTGGYFFDTCDFDPGPGVYKLGSNGGKDIFISKLDSTGNFIWAKSFGGPSDDYIGGISIDDIENVYITGSFSDTVDFDPGQNVFNIASLAASNAYINKLDSSGNFVWAKTIAGIGVSVASDIKIYANKIYISGSFRDIADFDPGSNVFNLISTGGGDIFISKLDTLGNFIWAKSFGGSSDDFNYRTSMDSHGNIYNTGYYYSTSADYDPGPGVYNLTSNGSSDVYISKLDSSGNFLWAKSMGGSSADLGLSIAVDDFDDVYVGGAFQGTSNFGGINLIANTLLSGDPVVTSDFFILKLVQSGVLPVQLINIKAYQKNGKLNIEWMVSDENNVLKYEVQRSHDGLHFSDVGTVKAKANNNFVTTYNLIDSNFFDGINFYRIKIIDNDNSFTYSQIVKLYVSGKAGEIKIYPNPITNNQFTLELNNLPIGTYTITLYNKLGQEIIKKLLFYQGGISKKVISISKTLSSGIYQLKIKSKDSNFIKQLIKK